MTAPITERTWTSKIKYVWGIYLLSLTVTCFGLFWFALAGWIFVLVLAGHPIHSSLWFHVAGICCLFVGSRFSGHLVKIRWKESLIAGWRISIDEGSVIVTGIAGRLETHWGNVFAIGAGPNGSVEIICAPWGRVRVPLHGYLPRERAEIQRVVGDRSRATIISVDSGDSRWSFELDEVCECWYDSDTADAVIRMADGRVLRVKTSDASSEQQAAIVASADARLDAAGGARTLVSSPRDGKTINRRTGVSARAKLAGWCVSEAITGGRTRGSWMRRGTGSS